MSPTAKRAVWPWVISLALCACNRSPASTSPPSAASAAPVPSAAAPSSTAASTSPSTAPTIASTPLPLPGSPTPTNFDDFQFDSASGKILIPSGQAGNLDVVDPATHAVTAIGGFSTQPAPNGHHGGITSASAGAGLWFTTDRSTRTLNVVDRARGKVVATAKLSGGPDYVRYVAPTSEVWVTEPHDGGNVEIFKLQPGATPTLTRTGSFAVPDAPESLVIDATRGRVYTNDEPKQKTEAYDIKTHALVATWANACTGEASGLVLDEARGFAVIGCGEGAASVIDVAHDGKKLGYMKAVSKTDNIAFDASLSHVYVPGAESGTMAILGLSPAGDLSVLGLARAAHGSKCVVVDDRHTAYVCDPEHGQLLVVNDPFPATK